MRSRGDYSKKKVNKERTLTAGSMTWISRVLEKKLIRHKKEISDLTYRDSDETPEDVGNVLNNTHIESILESTADHIVITSEERGDEENDEKEKGEEKDDDAQSDVCSIDDEPDHNPNNGEKPVTWYDTLWRVTKKFVMFLGPGIMVAVAYMDPGNYSTDVSGGAQFQYKMLFVILLSTILALYLQTLAIRLGSVTGRDLAENCHEHFHKYLSWFIWILAEAAIMATDVAEVAGTAIALKVLLNVPLIAGVFITIVDVLLVLLVYGRDTGMKALRLIEVSVTVLLMTVVICFCVILGRIPKENVGTVLYGYVPSHAVVSGEGIYAAAGILGATVMPHSLYLGSAQVIPRVRDHDMKHGYLPKAGDISAIEKYRPSVQAINSTVRYSVAELFVALITVALFANSAILITAGDTLYGTPDSATADLFSLNKTLQQYLGKGPAIVFFVALLASGLSAGIICTIAGQVVSEGHIRWKTKPWLRRLVTRIVTMIPCVVVVACLGESGISDALNWSQVVLTITLPFLATPLVYLTSRRKVMEVKIAKYNRRHEQEETDETGRNYANGWISMAFGFAVCLFITIVNVYNLVEVGLTGDV